MVDTPSKHRPTVRAGQAAADDGVRDCVVGVQRLHLRVLVAGPALTGRTDRTRRHVPPGMVLLVLVLVLVLVVVVVFLLFLLFLVLVLLFVLNNCLTTRPAAFRSIQP